MNNVTPQNWLSTIKKHPSQLNLSQIVEISLTKLKELREAYLKDEIKEAEYINVTTDITDYLIELISAEETTWHQSRRWPFFLSILSSFLIVGIPFLLKMGKDKKQFQIEIDRLRNEVLLAKEANAQAMVSKKIHHIPELLKEIKEKFKDHRREELINNQMMTDWEDYENIPLESRPPYDAEFESDIKKGVSFRRIDKTLHIEDQEAVPSSLLTGEQRVKAGAAFIQELIKQPEDQRWALVLQIAVTHATLFTAFKAALSTFNIDAANVQWEKNGKYYSIMALLSNASPPIHLEIIRHPQTRIIEKVKVMVKGSIDIVSYDTEKIDIYHLLIPNAITEELTYSITFGENDRPLISDLHSQMSANININK